MENPWIELPTSAPFVLPSDDARVTAFNERTRLSDCKRLQLDLLPEPYIDRLDAPIVFLKLNPGYTPDDIHFTGDAYAREVWRRNLRHQPLDYPFYPLDPALARAANAQWWRRKIRQVLAHSDERTVANNVLCVEAFPYHSYAIRDSPGYSRPRATVSAS